MTAFGFKKQFAPAVESGAKPHTIRARRRDGRPPAKPGGPISLYCGLRTKSCRLLGRGTCTGCWPITIVRGDGHCPDKAVIAVIDGVGLTKYGAALADFARADGFATVAEFMDFFTTPDQPVFEGWLIEWTLTGALVEDR